MKLKEARICCAFSWNPRDTESNQLMIAAGSVAGAMDDNFSSEAFLEIRKVDLSNTTSTDLPVIGRVVMPDRAHRIHWTSHGGSNGMIAAGLVDGTVKIWSADKMLEVYDSSADIAANVENDDPFGTNSPAAPLSPAGGDVDPEAATLCVIPAHQNGVRGLQFNPMRRDLLATGGGDRELCIWSLTNPTEPLKVPTPPKSTHPGEITDVRWNVKFEHIIGTTTNAGTFSLWDLRSLRQTQQISGQLGSATTLAWHPEGLTQVAIARDGVNPVVQIWDLKKANAPIKELRGHQNGVVGLAWCHDDANLLFSAGCDGRTICWNPNSGELVGELAPQNNWVTDVAWCPRVPAIVATASFDSTLAIHAAQDVSGGGIGSSSSPFGSNQNASGSAAIPKAVPKWLNRPCSASFGFGGRIVRLNKRSGADVSTLEIVTTEKVVNEEESAFRAEFKASAGNPEWIASKGHADIAAVATSNAQGNREAVLGYLGVVPSEVLADIEKLNEGFDQADEKQVDALVARCVASGQLGQAVDLCLANQRFDDAFAIAYLRGTEEVSRVHQAFIAHRSQSSRYAAYVGAIATKNLTGVKSAVSSKAIPWREALAVLTSFLPPKNFGEAATDMGSALESSGDFEGAASCYICAGAVDAAARLWHKTKSLSDFIHATEIFEVVAKSECREKVFVDALATYSDQLAKAGDYKAALGYAARAARMGSMEGAVVADLCQSNVAPADRLDVRFPFTPIQIPESRSPIVQQIAAMQQPVARPQQQQAQQQHPNSNVTPARPTQQSLSGFANNGNVPPHHQHPSLQQNTYSSMGGGAAGPNPNTMNTNAPMGGRPMPMPMNTGNPMGGPSVPQQQQGYSHGMNSHQQMMVNSSSSPAPPPPHGNFQPSQYSVAPGPQAAANRSPSNMMPPPPQPNNQVNTNNNNNMGVGRPLVMSNALLAGGASGSPIPPPMPPPVNTVAPPPMPMPMPPMPMPQGRPTGAAAGVPPPPMGPSSTNMGQQSPVGGSPHVNTPPPMPTTNSNPQPAGLNSNVNGFAPLPSVPQQPYGGAAQSLPVPAPTPTPAAPIAMTRPSGLVASTFGGPTGGPSLSATGSGLGLSAVVFTYDVSTISSNEGQGIASAIITATNNIKEKRKRDSIEKAALELFSRLSRNEVSPPCLALLSAYVAALGTPAAKDTWRKISDAHFGEIGPYLNLKFL